MESLEFTVILTEEEVKKIRELQNSNIINDPDILFEKEATEWINRYSAGYTLYRNSIGDVYETIELCLETETGIETVDVQDYDPENDSTVVYLKDIENDIDICAKINIVIQ